MFRGRPIPAAIIPTATRFPAASPASIPRPWPRRRGVAKLHHAPKSPPTDKEGSGPAACADKTTKEKKRIFFPQLFPPPKPFPLKGGRLKGKVFKLYALLF